MSNRLKQTTDNIFQTYYTLENDYNNIECIRCSTFIFSVLLSNRKSLNLPATFDFNSFESTQKGIFDILLSIFPELYNSYTNIGKKLTADNQNKLIKDHVKAINCDSDHKDDLLAWFYQYGKRKKEKIVFTQSLKNGKKVTGSDILTVTQFFTDRYMVKRLVADSLEHIKASDLRTLKIIDPACGGGNFLTFAFEYLLKKFREDLKENGAEIIENILVGYDADIELAGIAKVNLFLKYSDSCQFKKKLLINIFGGVSSNAKGFFEYKPNKTGKIDPSRSKFIALDPWSNRKINLNELLEKSKIRIFLTNPPFMGRRDMEINLKKYLNKNYPLAKSDLCVAFLSHCLSLLEKNDIFGVVSQTSWLYLSSYKEFRHNILNNFSIVKCYDLGSDAFIDISGEKTNVALIIFSKGKGNSRFYYLKNYPHSIKKKMIDQQSFKEYDVFEVDQKQFLQNKNCEISYLLSGKGSEIFLKNPKYSKFAIPMQGTSTGRNSDFIDYSWNRSKDQDWVLVSKGGGYCKWQGLNFFRVKWGINASLIKRNTGSALRNISRIKDTQLVYSDTGTLGMNVRLLLPGQVFIASGPGILVTKGNQYAHLGFLNSRVSTFFLRVFSPKLTISAGYIKELPVLDSVLESEKLALLSKECIRLKRIDLSRTLPNEEFINSNPELIKNLEGHLRDLVISSLKNELSRLEIEKIIDKYIFDAYGFSKNYLRLIGNVAGKNVWDNPVKKIRINPKQIDERLSKCLDVNTAFFTKNGSCKCPIGAEGFLEYSSHQYGVHPNCIFEHVLNSVDDLKLVKKLFLSDLIHKAVLYYLGYNSNTNYNIVQAELTYLDERILSTWPMINKSLTTYFGKDYSLLKWLSEELEFHHNRSFYGSPILEVKGNNVGEKDRVN